MQSCINHWFLGFLTIFIELQSLNCNSGRRTAAGLYFPNDEALPDGAVSDNVKSLQDGLKYQQSPNWKLNTDHFGQISAVAINKKGNVVIFHRGDHVWNGLYVLLR